jgi:hypothetical protein
MNVRITIGKGVTGAVRYCLGEGRHPVTGELLPKKPDGSTRVEWIGGTGFSFPIRTLADIERARILMELDAQNQPARRGGWRCEQDCVHLVLSWRPGEEPTRNDVEEAAKDALASLGMESAKALFFVHNDEDYAHIHIVASKINPGTGRAYDLKGNYLILSRWAEQYEREHGGVINLRRADMNELRAAIRDRDAGAVAECMTRQRPTITEDQVRRALQKEIHAPRGASLKQKQSVEADRSRFHRRILAHPDVIRLREDTPSGPMMFKLKKLQFQVIYRTEVDTPFMTAALQDFLDELTPDSVAVFYFAGHGAQRRGANYLLPTDSHFATDGLVLSRTLEAIAQRHSRFVLAIIDACRTDAEAPQEPRLRSPRVVPTDRFGVAVRPGDA